MSEDRSNQDRKIDRKKIDPIFTDKVGKWLKLAVGVKMLLVAPIVYGLWVPGHFAT